MILEKLRAYAIGGATWFLRAFSRWSGMALAAREVWY